MNPSRMPQREAKCTMLVGAPGHGKTTLIRRLLTAEPLKSLVLVPDIYDKDYQDYDLFNIERWDLLSQFHGARRLLYSKDALQQIRTGFYNGTIALEDMRSELPAWTQQAIKGIIARRRHANTDVIASVHGWSELPPGWIPFVDRWIIFRVSDDIGLRKRNFARNVYLELERLTVEVNQGAEKIKWYHRLYDVYS